MADSMIIDVDTRALLAAMDALGVEAERHTKAAAKITADNIAGEARRRVARRTGQTAAGIVVREDYTRAGYIVAAERNPYPILPMWLEFGTKFMTPRPFFFASARLEEGAHERRMREAIQQAINAVGFGG